MSEYNTGTVAVTNASTTVVGTGTLWLANITAGDIFTKVGSGVSYIVGSVTDDTHLELTGAYAGTTESGISYTISTSFTSPDSIPYPQLGDTQPATILARMAAKIQDLFTGLGTSTDYDVGTSGATIPLLSTANTWSLAQDFSASGIILAKGTFTPTIVGTTTAGTGTYTTQAGYYTEFDDCYVFTLDLAWTAHTGTGNMDIGGLPFTSAAGNQGRGAVAIGRAAGLSTGTAGRMMIAVANSGATTLRIREVDVSTGVESALVLDTAVTLLTVSGTIFKV